MRLLHTTKIDVVEFIGVPPPYAILSHRWEEEEVTLRDLEHGLPKQMKGYEKIQVSCTLASSQGFEYIWIDTCCIHKSSSAELSEAINSMFKWYQDAKVCYAFLSDVVTSVPINSGTPRQDPTVAHEMTASQWFTRGWTLQELIAPQTVHFYNQKWVYLGSRDVVAEAIELATAIPARALHGKGLLGISTYQRMQWASTRTTTRPEDMAYCLLGIFDVNIPLLYGEGKKQALQRLQEEIIRKSTDLSLFLWTAPREEDQGPDLEFRGLLAEDPSWFTSPRSDGFHGFDELFRKNDSGIVPLQDTAIAITNKGTSVRWTIMPVPTDPAGTLHLAMLAESGDVVGGILIQQLDQDATEFCRVLSDKLIWIDRRGDTTKVWNHDLLGSPDDLLRVSLDSGPRSFYVRAHFDLSNEPSYSGVGFSFTRHKILEGPLESFWADIVGSSPEFRQDSDSESPTWVARFRLERDSEFFRTPWEMRKSKVLGALVTSITARSNRGMRKPIGDRCVVVGVDVLPQTAIGTMNTFLEPWIVNTNEITPEDAIRKLGSCAEPSKWRDYDIGKRIWGRERRCSLRKLTRVSGLWSDIRITISG